MEASAEIIEKLKQRYGEKEGMRIFLTVMPGITADFQKMLLSSPPHKTVQEEYRLDDGRTTLALTGSRDEHDQISLSVQVL